MIKYLSLYYYINVKFVSLLSKFDVLSRSKYEKLTTSAVTLLRDIIH